MKKKQQIQKKTKTSSTVYLTVALILIISIFAIFCLYKLGVINLSSSFDETDSANPTPPSGAPSAIIGGVPEKKDKYEAIPREEFASALSKIQIPSGYYRNYKIAISSDTNQYVTEYFVIKKNNDWWVQTAVDSVIMQTAICKDGSVTLTDNAANTSVTMNGVSFEERCGIITLDTLVNMIHDIASGVEVTYGGGIADYSLSFTQMLTSGENLFSFSFLCHNGIHEEYTFSFENAVILSASKSYDGKIIYKMEMKDYRNNLSEIDTESLFLAN